MPTAPPRRCTAPDRPGPRTASGRTCPRQAPAARTHHTSQALRPRGQANQPVGHRGSCRSGAPEPGGPYGCRLAARPAAAATQVTCATLPGCCARTAMASAPWMACTGDSRAPLEDAAVTSAQPPAPDKDNDGRRSQAAEADDLRGFTATPPRPLPRRARRSGPPVSGGFALAGEPFRRVAFGVAPGSAAGAAGNGRAGVRSAGVPAGTWLMSGPVPLQLGDGLGG
jgi:hypothetical protein